MGALGVEGSGLNMDRNRGVANKNVFVGGDKQVWLVAGTSLLQLLGIDGCGGWVCTQTLVWQFLCPGPGCYGTS